jgi:hypothetical protein
MRLLACTILASGTLLAVAPSHAQTYDPNYPVCMQVAEWGGLHIECSFTSLPQCAATASGRSAECYANPYFAYAHKEPPGRVYRRHQRVY